MDFNRHSNLSGLHSFLSPSNYHWIRYDEDKLDRVWYNHSEAKRGSDLHALAHDMIRLGVKLPDTEQTLNMYVNDAVGFRMTPEQTLFYSENCFGTADAISYRAGKLRIHDLKNGTNPASMEQLLVYMAIFCLEYKFRPSELQAELRIYQNNEIQALIPDPVDVVLIIDKIITFDKRIKRLRAEA